MGFNFYNDMPIYLQISNEITNRIVNNEYQIDQQLPSIRELAKEFGVNPNTMQKALNELDQKKIIESRRTSGNFVSISNEHLNELKIEIANQSVEHYFKEMQALNYSKQEAIDYLIEKKGD